MKSIIEQASSVIKAIEKAWNQANNPKDFSIKIFEKEEKNFFGLTTKQAKIGIFYTDKPVSHEKPVAKPRQEIVKETRPVLKEPSKQAPTTQSEKHSTCRQEDQSHTELYRANQPKPPARKPISSSSASINRSQENPLEKTQKISTTWNDTMSNSAQDWLKKTLTLMEMRSIGFTTEIAGKILKLTFNQPLIIDSMQEKQLFRSLAHLVMASLRNQYKQKIKDLKVILIRPE